MTTLDIGTDLVKWFAIGILYVALEVAAEFVLGIVIAMVWEVLRAPFRSERELHPVAATTGLVVFGAACGGASFLFHQQRVLPDAGPRGLSVLLAPAIVGFVMHKVGQWRTSNGRPLLTITTFRGAATFAAAMAWTRYFLFFHGPG